MKEEDKEKWVSRATELLDGHHYTEAVAILLEEYARENQPQAQTDAVEFGIFLLERIKDNMKHDRFENKSVEELYPIFKGEQPKEPQTKNGILELLKINGYENDAVYELIEEYLQSKNQSIKEPQEEDVEWLAIKQFCDDQKLDISDIGKVDRRLYWYVKGTKFGYKAAKQSLDKFLVELERRIEEHAQLPLLNPICNELKELKEFYLKGK